MNVDRQNEQRDLFRGALEMMILESLRQQPMHGYALMQHIRQRSNDLLQVEDGPVSAAAADAPRETGEGGVDDLADEPQSANL